jgi:hypothetical protein
MVFTIAIAAQIAEVPEPAGLPRPQAVRVTLCNERRCSRTQVSAQLDIRWFAMITS